MADIYAPTATARPLTDSVGLFINAWYAAFNVSISPAEARMLAIHLCHAADEAEAKAREAVQTAARDAGVCAEVSA